VVTAAAMKNDPATILFIYHLHPDALVEESP
jgi:hypothetical protein